MLAQQKLLSLLDDVTRWYAAAQQNLQKANVQVTQIGQNPIYTFTALQFCILQADQGAVSRRFERDLNFPTMNGRFVQERTVTKNAARSETRDMDEAARAALAHFAGVVY